MAEATHSGFEDLASFARLLQADLSALKAGLTRAWSNGITEDEIHRLRQVKYQDYGRDGFTLLRQCVPHAT